MAQYQYVDATGQLKTIDANDANSALSSIKSLGLNSGVMEVKTPTTQPVAQTAPVQSPYSPTVSTDTPISQMYGYQPNEIDNALSTNASYYKTLSETPVDENAIFENKRKQFQAEIDAVDRIYADKIAAARVQGQGRIGSNTAMQGRSGLLGSDFGAAQTDNINTQNRDIENAYLDEKSMKINEILGKVRSEAVAEAEAKRQAKEAGAKSYIEFLTAQETRKKERITDFAKSLLAKGVDIATLSDKELSEIARSYGTTKENLLASYKDSKVTYDKSKPSYSDVYGPGIIGE